MILVLLLAACLNSVEEGSHMAAMAEYGREHCGDESGDPRSCRIRGWFAGNSGEVSISTFPRPIDEQAPDQALDLYMIRSGDGEFNNGYAMRHFPLPSKADPAMIRLAQELEAKNCKGYLAGADPRFEYQGEWVHSPCVSVFGADGTIEVVVLPDPEQVQD